MATHVFYVLSENTKMMIFCAELFNTHNCQQQIMPCEVAHLGIGSWLQYSHPSPCFCVTIPVLHNPSAVGEKPTEHFIYFTKIEKFEIEQINSIKQTAVLRFKKREAPEFQEISTFSLRLTKIAENFDIVDPDMFEDVSETDTRHIYEGGEITPIDKLCLQDNDARRRQYQQLQYKATLKAK